ncbi:MAG: tetratricopeptide repeat protein [Chitinispirillia bacterium]|nr:tetratricopeptide repeat protein [Chitinispirillia bacterium]
MSKRTGAFAVFVRFVFIVLIVMVSSASAQRGQKKIEDMTPEEKQARMNELLKQREKMSQQKAATVEANRPTGQSLTDIITRYERLLEQCAVRKSERCADVMFTLGSLYYDQDRDNFVKAVENHDNAIRQWERSGGRGSPPVSPIPNYDKALRMYWQLTREYPQFNKLPEAFTQMANIYLVAGALDTTKMILQQLVQRFPRSPRVSGAHFRLADLAFMDHKFKEAADHLEKVKQNEIDPISWEMSQYRRAECAYNMGDFDKAVELFHNYVVNCDAGRYPRREFREMALEYMAIAFSDMQDGAEEAVKFFRKHPNKPYEAQVIYTVGMKNRNHGQWDQAISALTVALNKFPMYKEAPMARQALIECFVVKKEHKRANDERERLVDDYGPGSKWYQANSNERVVIEKSRNEVRRALGAIAIYYHAEAQRTRDRSMYERAMKRYQEFFQKFPDDKWRIYEYRYNIAEIYSSLGDCEKAAENYNFVAMEDLSKYPPFVPDVDTLGMDPEQLEKLKATKGDKSSPVAISQEDAGYNVIVALDNCRKKEMAKESLDDEKAYALPSTRKLIDYCLQFQRRFPKSSNAPEVLYLAGNIHYGAKQWGPAITTFKQIMDEYKDAKIAPNAMRLLANSYSFNGQFDLAMSTYKALLAKTPPNSNEFAEIVDLAAGAMYRHAENFKRSGNLEAAATAFKAIANEFPNSQVADRGWFEAGVCYEEMKNYDRAAETFLELTEKFPRSTIRENSYIRAAGNYKKTEKWDRAAQVYLTAANNIPKAEFAIPSLSSASECYQKLGQYDMAGKMFELIFERYRNDPQTPQALYNAGLIFEKGKHYHNAISVYESLANNYPQSEFAGEAFFSIGLCWEKLEEFAKMANSFTDYAKRYTSDRFKQVQALVKAGNAYFNMGNMRDAEKAYLDAIKIYEQYSKTSDIDVANVAQAYFMLGEIIYKRFDDTKLAGRNEREVANSMRQKTAILTDAGRRYAEAVSLGVEEWTLRATYMLGKGFYDLEVAFANQPLFGNEMQKLATRMGMLSTREKFYDEAIQSFGRNIGWAKEWNIKDDYIEKSMQAIMEMAYRKGAIVEELARLFKSAPVPPGLSEEELEYYTDMVEEKFLELLDAALPKYEEAMMLARDIGIASSPWIDSIKARILDINPASEAVNIVIVQWVPEERVDEDGNVIPSGPRDPELDRNIRRIGNIMTMNIGVDEKISQLQRIKMEADRNILMEQERINELRKRAGN